MSEATPPPLRIPFNRACLVGEEMAYMARAIEQGHISGDGPYTRRCERILEELTGAERVFLTTSCTHALEMAAMLLDIRRGDEIIVPSFTFVSTVNAFVLRGATPVFADIRPDTLNLDETQLPSLVSARTRAVVPVHYAGVGCELDSICAFARSNDVVVIEDNAHGLLGHYRGHPLGSFGSYAVQSFHETKNFTCGEAGALVVNDPAAVERAEILREKGTDRGRFSRGLVDRYTWVDVGSSYVPSDLLAAFLCAQLEAHETVQSRRRRIWEVYAAGLGDWAAEVGARLPVVPAHCGQAYHMFYVLMPTPADRTALIADLREAGILSVFHYVPLHRSPMGEALAAGPAHLPVTEHVAERLLRLPFFADLRPDEQEQVIDRVCAYRAG